MIEGQLTINVWYNKNAEKDTTVEKVEVSSTRPLHASQIVIGKSPQAAMQMIPLMFNICGIAQTFNAYAVLNQGKINNHNALNIVLLTETLKEHLLRIFLDSPKLLELKAKKINLPFVAQLVKSMQNKLFANQNAFELNTQQEQNKEKANTLIDEIEDFLVKHVFSIPLDQWQGIESERALKQWINKSDTLSSKAVAMILSQGWASQGAIVLKSLPHLATGELTKVLNQENSASFIAQPTWQGETCETTPLTRQKETPLIKAVGQKYGSGLLSRWLARLVEIAKIPSQMRTRLNHPDQETKKIANIAQIEAARGRLIHRAIVEKNSIKSYQIIAPTEWNFHPQGCVVESLKNIKANSKAEFLKIAHLIINSIDPCVGYQLRIR